MENRILANFPGKLRYGLEELRAIHFGDVPTVTGLIELEETEGRHIFESIAQIILSYVLCGIHRSCHTHPDIPVSFQPASDPLQVYPFVTHTRNIHFWIL